MNSILKTSSGTFKDQLGIASILSKEELFRFLQVKHIIPETAQFCDYQNRLSEYITDVSHYKEYE